MSVGDRARLALRPCPGPHLRVLTLPVGRASGEGQAPRVRLNSTGAGTADTAGTRRGPRPEEAAQRRSELAAEAGRGRGRGGTGGGRLGGTGKEERNRPLQVPSARRAASAPPGGKAAFPSPIVTLLSIRSRFLPRLPRGTGGHGIRVSPELMGSVRFPRHRRYLNFQQMWKITFTCVCISLT